MEDRMITNLDAPDYKLWLIKRNLVIYNEPLHTYLPLSHASPILYVWDNYFSDSNKEVFEVNIKAVFDDKHLKTKSSDASSVDIHELTFDGVSTKELLKQNQISFKKKLKKNIFKATGRFLVDVFGDCFINLNTFLAGTLCGVVDCCSNSKFLILADKYNRVWLVDANGKIVKFFFVSNKIESVICGDSHIVVCYDLKHLPAGENNPTVMIQLTGL